MILYRIEIVEIDRDKNRRDYSLINYCHREYCLPSEIYFDGYVEWWKNGYYIKRSETL